MLYDRCDQVRCLGTTSFKLFLVLFQGRSTPRINSRVQMAARGVAYHLPLFFSVKFLHPQVVISPTLPILSLHC